jgi:hypothetical protein
VRPQRHPDYVWCEFHGEIHQAQMDFYDEDYADDCAPKNWRKVYVSGVKDEFLL